MKKNLEYDVYLCRKQNVAMIHYFNPGHETAVLNQSAYYMPPSNVVLMQKELSFLPAWYAGGGDSVLVDRVLNDEFVEIIDQIGLRVSPMQECGSANLSNEEVLLWGVSPQAIHYFEELNEKHNISLRLPAWDDKLIYLNSRLFARDCLNEICSLFSSEIEKDILPHVFYSLDEVGVFLKQRSGRYVSKAPYSSSGRGLLWLPETGLTRTESQILHGILKKQKSVSIEKVLDKKIDFAMEFFSDGEQVTFEGYSLFQTNEKGGYLSNTLVAQEVIEKQLTEIIAQDELIRIRESLQTILTRECAAVYKGCIGVDMMVYVNDEGNHALHPCLEVNMRYNMGYLSLCLHRNYISQSSSGNFYLGFGAKDGQVYQEHRQMMERYPLVIEGGKVESGYLPLCPVDPSSRFCAYALVR